MLRRNITVLISAAIGLAILCGLGTWQVKRLAWKEGLIATLEARMAQAPVPLADALKRVQAGDDVEYLKVRAVGQLDTSHVLLKQTSFKTTAGWEGLAPFRADDGTEVLVDLGAAASRAVSVQPVTEITGTLRLHNLGRGLFDPANNAGSNTWFWWDVPAMQKAAGMKEGGAWVILQAGDNPSGFTAAAPRVELRNNHLGYAITWFGLAAALLGVTAAFVLRKADLK